MKTIRVRIAVAVNQGGFWNANGWNVSTIQNATDGNMERAAKNIFPINESITIHWIEADIPLPEEVTINGEVK